MTAVSRWGICQVNHKGRSNLFTGAALTRAAAIAEHVHQARPSRRDPELDAIPRTCPWPQGGGGTLSDAQRRLWKWFRRQGHRAVLLTVTYTEPQP